MKTDLNGKFEFDGDTKNCHRFLIVADEGGVQARGTIYITKKGPGIPKRIVLLNSKALEDEQG